MSIYSMTAASGRFFNESTVHASPAAVDVHSTQYNDDNYQGFINAANGLRSLSVCSDGFTQK